ncbi:MAG: phosphotransferase [Candidimonas sp.]|jgi:aminoglycoside/choline kinase family phosphotransferase
MDNSQRSNTDARYADLTDWLTRHAGQFDLDLNTLAPASSDASFRRYFRLAAGASTVIAMDAPPPHEDCRPFVHVTQLLKDAGSRVPDILAQDLERGFLLLSDLGRHTYYQAVQSGIDDGGLQALYRNALDALVRLQHADARSLPVYDGARLTQELEVFTHWYAHVHCAATLSNEDADMLSALFATLTADNAQQPRVLVHRDFHSPNLMVPTTQHDGGLSATGVIDFQDALSGPITYDIASLVMDARTTWEEPQQLDWAIRYWEAAKAAGLPVDPDFAEFHRAYEWMSLQRNLRILGVFSRLSHRDGKHHYLDHMPRVMAYVRQVAGRYGAFRPLLKLLDRLENRQTVDGYTF